MQVVFTNSCAYTRGTCAYMCKIWSFCDQTCGQEDCPQMTMPMTMTTMPTTTHDGQFMIVSIGSLAGLPNEPTMTLWYTKNDSDYDFANRWLISTVLFTSSNAKHQRKNLKRNRSLWMGLKLLISTHWVTSFLFLPSLFIFFPQYVCRTGMVVFQLSL